MWLLDITTLELKQFIGRSVPPYAILSHTWGMTEDEVSFKEMRKHRTVAETKKGFSKIKNCCLKAVEDGLQYAWIDSCCIDKRSSAELSEAINSMYKYYAESKVCYAYLEDVPSSSGKLTAKVSHLDFANSRWFTRGWTLQEVIAPMVVQFFASNWSLIDTKGLKIQNGTGFSSSESTLFLEQLASITKIPKTVLGDPKAVRDYSSAERMSWASRRETTRVEDAAYSLLGLFDIHMPILYGEGETKAFHRLQLEIIQRIPDQSIFAWRREPSGSDSPDHSGLLANSPRDFLESSNILITHRQFETFPSYKMTSMGLRIRLATSHINNSTYDDHDHITGYLHCWKFGPEGLSHYVGIKLRPYVGITVEGARCVMYRRERINSFKFKPFVDGIKGKIMDIHVLEDAQIEYFQSEDRAYTEYHERATLGPVAGKSKPLRYYQISQIANSIARGPTVMKLNDVIPDQSQGQEMQPQPQIGDIEINKECEEETTTKRFERWEKRDNQTT